MKINKNENSVKISNFKLKIIRLISSKILFFVFTTGIIIGLNLTPLILQMRHSPSGRTFAMIHNNAQDFFFYQSIMNEGASGSWLIKDPYTSEPHQQSFIFAYFAWLGKISRLIGFPYALTYHLIRIIVSILFLIVTFKLLLFLKLPHPRLTYFLFLFASPFLHQINDYGKLTTVPFMNWWTAMDPIRRVAYLPHHMFGSLFLVLSLLMIIKFIKSGNNKYIFWTISFAILLSFVHTPSLLIILIILPVSAGIYFLFNKKLIQKNQKVLIGLIGYWLTGVLLMVFMLLQTKNGFPWSQYIDWEKNLQFPLDRELIGAFGILFPFAILGIVKALKTKRFEYILIACWFVVPLLFIPFAPKLNISNIRLIQGVPYLPLAILTVLGIHAIVAVISNFQFLPHQRDPASGGTISNQFQNSKFQNLINTLIIKTGDASEEIPISTQTDNRRSSTNLGYASGRTRKLRFLIIITVLIIFSYFTYPTLKWSLKDQIREYWPIFGNVYLDNRLNDAFSFINRNYPNKTVTLSTFYTGNYLPAFTHTTSFIGHFGYTYNIDEKDKNVRKFFEDKMAIDEAKEFIVNNKITLIWQGPEEKPIYKDYLYPEILKPVYDKEEVTIYNLK